MKRKELYNTFHNNTMPQKYRIDERNFTYHIILGVINKYLKHEYNVLDIGCGAGTLAIYIASKVKKTHGIDISEAAIRACNESVRVLGLEGKLSFEVIDFPNHVPQGVYDIVVFSEVIEHLRKDQVALNKIFSMLKKGGIVIISTPSRNAPLYRWGFAKEFDKRVGHLRRYTQGEIVDKCIKAGFEIIETNKTEGLLRNFLFLNPYAGKFVRFVKYPITIAVNFIDQILLTMFGESQLFVIAKKV